MNQEKDPRNEASVPEGETSEKKTAAENAPEETEQQESPAPEANKNGETEPAQTPEPEEKNSEGSKSEEEPSEEETTAENAPEKTKQQESPTPEANKDGETEPAQASEPEEKDSKPEKKAKKKKKSGKSRTEFFKSTKFRHGSISTAFTAGFIVVVILVNILVGVLVNRFPSVNLDLTQNGSNTLSSEGLKVIDSVNIPTDIYICATQQQVEDDEIYPDYGLKYSQVGSLFAKAAERNSKISVQYIDLDKNPTFAADYQSDSLTTGDVVVKTDKRYRVLTYSDLFNIQYSSDYTSTEVYSNVESALISALNAVITDKLPIVAFDTGHAEGQDMSAFENLLKNNSFETSEFNLLTDSIPENTQMIVLGEPTTDYTDDEITKLSNFLSSTTLAGDRSLMVTFAPSQSSMPKLATFLAEWGIQVSQSVIVESDQSQFISNNPSDILSNIQSDLSLKGDSSSSTDYGYFVTPLSSPVNLLFETKGDKKTYSLAKSSDSCYLVDSSTESTENLSKQASNTVALCQETITGGKNDYKANVIAVGSSSLFTDGIINSSAFGNGTYMVDLSKYATGTSNSSTDVQITSQPLNATDISITSQASAFLGVGVFILLIPLIIAIIGITVYNKRRRL